MAYKPTAPYAGSLPDKVVRKGSKGQHVKHLQNFLNWCMGANLVKDGIAGKATAAAIKQFQSAYKLKKDGIFGAKSKAKAKTIIAKYKPKPAPKPAPVVKSNTQKLQDKVKELSWPKGTAKRKYAWKGGSATVAFKKALAKVYPNHNQWSAAPSKGCSCDVAVGTVVRAAGIDKKYPRGLTISYTSSAFTRKVYKNVKPSKVAKDGDIVLFTKSGGGGHTFIKANGMVYEASYQGTYLHCGKGSYSMNHKRPKVVILRPKG